MPLYIITVVLVMYKPETVIIFLIIFTSTIFNIDAFPQPISSGKFGFYIAEALIIFLLVRTFLVALMRRDFKKMASPITVPILLLFLWILFSCMKAIITQRATLLDVILVGRGFIYYANFFLVLYYVDSKEKLNLVFRSLLIIAGICTVFSFIQYILGPDNKIFPWNAWVVYRIRYHGEGISLARVMPFSISLIYFFLFPILVGIINGSFSKNVWYKIFVIVASLSLFLSFTRNVYYSVLLGIFLIWLNYKIAIKLQMIRKTITVLFAVLLIAYSLVFIGVIEATDWWQQVVGRHEEVFVDGVYTQTLAWRAAEAKVAIDNIAESPIIGNGIGSTFYHPYLNCYTSAIHNGYFTIVFQMGLIGLLIFVFIFYRFISCSIQIYRSASEKYYQNIILGFLVAFIALLPAVWIKPVFVHEVFWISLLGVIWAIPQVILNIQRHEVGGNKR